MPRLRVPFFSASSQSNITPAPNAAWSLIGSPEENLLNELEKLYWEGVKGELENIVRTLQKWQQLPEESTVALADEDDDHIHGFDTFVDQVSQESRAFAIRYGEKRDMAIERLRETSHNSTNTPSMPHKEALKEHILDRKAVQSSAMIRTAVREAIKEMPKLTGTQQRVWMLLQGAGFLDMEKLIEHRRPLKKFGFWKRPAIPQLALSKFDEYWIPRFEPAVCTECRDIIRGSMFTSGNRSNPALVCEDCYRSNHYGKDGYVKKYKHCILNEIIDPATSRKICRCAEVPHFDSSGRLRALFPVDQSDSHLNVSGTGSIQCGLLKLAESVALAKYYGLQTTVGAKKPEKVGLKIASQQEKEKKQEADKNKKEEMEKKKVSGWKPHHIQTVTGTSLHDERHRSVASSTTTVATEAKADKDIPLFFRKFAEKYPFGNVHMALRIGPLVIENGVAHTRGGALITLRELPVFHERFNQIITRDRSLAVSGDAERTLWQQTRAGGYKRYKAVMKQVVGVPFTGVLSQSVELEVVEAILAASKHQFDNPNLPGSDQQKVLDSALNPAFRKLKELIESRVKIYLQSIAQRLLDLKTKLTWSLTSNNCQSFCDSMIDLKLFEPLVHSEIESIGGPLYTMSFVCPQQGYTQGSIKTKFDVPSGLTEEYLLKFHFGRHDEADIIDTYQEYWYDWGAFGGPLYKYQNLFPWDCTEAYGRYPTKCGDCNLAKHVWAFPFDSWSIVALHLTRDRHMYAPALDVGDAPLAATKGPPAKIAPHPQATQLRNWMRNRLTILTASALLIRAAAAMARTRSFHFATHWLHSNTGLRQSNPSLARVKLGGIHRAQPMSHYFEAGVYRHYFLAEWALLERAEQVRAYETMRDGRVKLPDVVRQGTVWSGQFAGADSSLFAGFGGIDVAMGAGADALEVGMDSTAIMADAGFDMMDSMADTTAPACLGSNCGTGCGGSGCGGGGGGGGCGGGVGGGGGCGGCGGGCGAGSA